MRAGYITSARFFRDSDEEVPIRWYRALPNAPTLPYPSIINSLNWSDSPWERTGPGEVWDSPRPFNGRFAPPEATGKHQCGTVDDFQFGEHFDPTLPPTIYGANGLPTCCNDPVDRKAAGGAAGGGTAIVNRSVDVISTGGAVAGGIAVVNVTGGEVATGGAVAGGTSESGVLGPFCDSYSLDPPLLGQSVVNRTSPGQFVWFAPEPVGVALSAAAHPDGTADWFLAALISFPATVWQISGWDGSGCATFERTSGPGPDEVEVCCAD